MRVCQLCGTPHTRGKHVLMKETKRSNSSFDVNVIKLIGSVPIDEIPPGTHTFPGRKRRWEALAEAILERSVVNEALVINVPTGSNAETVRQGVATELERSGHRSRVRSVIEQDGSVTLYLVSVAK